MGIGGAVKCASTASAAAEAPGAPEGSLVLIFFSPGVVWSERQGEAPLRSLIPMKPEGCLIYSGGHPQVGKDSDPRHSAASGADKSWGGPVADAVGKVHDVQTEYHAGDDGRTC